MNVALFYDGGVENPKSLPIAQAIIGTSSMVDAFCSTRIIKVTPSAQRRSVSDQVHTAFRINFGGLLRDNQRLTARILNFLSRVEAYYDTVASYGRHQNCLQLFHEFKLPLGEAHIFEDSGMTRVDLIWLKTALRGSADLLIGEGRRMDVLLMLSVSNDRASKTVTDLICDTHSKGMVCPWANKIAPVLERNWLTASRICANSLSVVVSKLERDGQQESPVYSTV